MEIEKETYTKDDFIRAYTALCQDYGYSIQAQPGWKLEFDGTFTLTIQMVVVEAVKNG